MVEPLSLSFRVFTVKLVDPKIQEFMTLLPSKVSYSF